MVYGKAAGQLLRMSGLVHVLECCIRIYESINSNSIHELNMDQVAQYLRSNSNLIMNTAIQPSSVLKAIHLNTFFIKQILCLAGIYDIDNVEIPSAVNMECKILLHKGKFCYFNFTNNSKFLII